VEALELSKDVSEIVHLESLHSEKAKQLALEIGNDAARKILKELYRNPASISDLSAKLNLPMSTVQYHVNRLMEFGLVRVARKRFGKRMREVKMYAYDKEGIVFLSSQKQEFASLLGRLIVQTVKGLSAKVGLLIFLVGLIVSSVGGYLLKAEIERIYLPGAFAVVGEGTDVFSLLLFSNFATFSIGALVTYLILIYAVKKK